MNNHLCRLQKQPSRDFLKVLSELNSDEDEDDKIDHEKVEPRKSQAYEYPILQLSTIVVGIRAIVFV